MSLPYTGPPGFLGEEPPPLSFTEALGTGQGGKEAVESVKVVPDRAGSLNRKPIG